MLVQCEVVLSRPGGDLSAHGDDVLAAVFVSNNEGAHNIARVSSHGARVGTDGRSHLMAFLFQDVWTEEVISAILAALRFVIAFCLLLTI